MDQFQYSRPFRKGEKDPDNEFAVSVFLNEHARSVSLSECSPLMSSRWFSSADHVDREDHLRHGLPVPWDPEVV